MQIQSVNAVSSSSNLFVPHSVLSSLSTGDILQAEVTATDQDQVILSLPQGVLLTANQRAAEPLRTGDTVLLQVSQEADESTFRLELISVNGQSLKPGVPVEEYALMRIQIAPSRENLAIAVALNEMGAPLRLETFSRMAELNVRFPALDTNEKLLLSTSSLPLNADSVEAFITWLNHPLKTADLAAAIETLANQDGLASATFEAAARQMPEAAGAHSDFLQASAFALPHGLSLGLTAKLEQSCIWQELCERFLTLPQEEASEFILGLMTALPPETTSAERNLLYQTLCNWYASQNRSGIPHAMEPREALYPTDVSVDDQQQLLHPQQGTKQAQATTENSIIKSALEGLFAAILEQPADKRGPALQESGAGLETRLRALASILQAQEGQQAARLKPVLELTQALTTQVLMGGELGNLLYIPLPVILNESRQDAGLYVLKRNGGASMLDESNVTVAICLDTQYLGPVDALLRVDRNEIDLRFRVENAGALCFFQECIDQEALSFPPPYRLQSACVMLRDVPITPLTVGQTLRRAFGLATPGGLDISI